MVIRTEVEGVRMQDDGPCLRELLHNRQDVRDDVLLLAQLGQGAAALHRQQPH